MYAQFMPILSGRQRKAPVKGLTSYANGKSKSPSLALVIKSEGPKSGIV